MGLASSAHRGLEPRRTRRLSAGAREGPRGPLASSDVARKISTLVESVPGGDCLGTWYGAASNPAGGRISRRAWIWINEDAKPRHHDQSHVGARAACPVGVPDERSGACQPTSLQRVMGAME